MTVPNYMAMTIQTMVNASEIVGLLDDATLLGSWEADGRVHLYWPIDAWSEEKPKNLSWVLQQLGDDRGAASITTSMLPGEDWNALWASQVKPIRIGRRILIRPSWDPVESSSDTIEFILDPKQAFGTGHHATTYLLIEWLEDCIQGGERVLDVGTGSGILAMVALRLGATSALGIDHDSVAIDCAHEYATVNAFGEELGLRTLTLAELQSEPFQLIVANLDRRTLLDHVSQFQRVNSAGTCLLLSGILQDDHDEIVGQYEQSGWKLVDVRERDGWLAVRLQSGRT